MLLLPQSLLHIFVALSSFALQINAKLRGLVLKERSDVALSPEDYYGMSTGREMERPYMKKLGFNIFGNKRNDSVIFPEDYVYKEYSADATKRRRKGMKEGGVKKNRLKQKQFLRFDITTTEEKELRTVVPTRSKSPTTKGSSSTTQKARQEYVWDIWPIITLSLRPTMVPSRRTKTLSSYFPTALSVKEKTRPWRLVEWSRGPTGLDDIYYNFYKDYYVADQVGKLNTYTGTPPKCHNQAIKFDGHVVNARVREELYDGMFLDYLKDRVRNYSTWSAYVRANPCFTTLTKFFGTTKILALFAARPLMRGKDPKEKNSIELYRKDYVVLTEPIPTTSTTHMMGLFMKIRPTLNNLMKHFTTTITDVRTTTRTIDLDTINEDDIISELIASDDMTRTKMASAPTRSRLLYEFFGSLRTRLYSKKNKSQTVQTNIDTPETWTIETENQNIPEVWTAETEDISDDEWLSQMKENRRRKNFKKKHYLNNVHRLARPSFDARKPPPQSSFTICYNCMQLHKSRESIGKEKACYDIFEGRDQRFRSQMLSRAYKCIYKENSKYTEASGKEHYGPHFRPGCTHRFLDIPSVYDDRYCRKWPPDNSNSNIATKRYQRLEKLLRFTENGCVTSPMASLTPFDRGISLWVRYHVCVCNTNYCNAGLSQKLTDRLGGYCVTLISIAISTLAFLIG